MEPEMDAFPLFQLNIECHALIFYAAQKCPSQPGASGSWPERSP